MELLHPNRGLNKFTSLAELSETTKVERITVSSSNKRVSCCTRNGELRQANTEAQLAIYDLSKLNEQAIGHPLVKLDWFDMVQKRCTRA